MNIIEPSVEQIQQQYNKETLAEDMMKHIEICGRNCYKSEDKITDNSYKRFVDALCKSNHGAMLEHGTIYITIPIGTWFSDNKYFVKNKLIDFFKQNKYSVVRNIIDTKEIKTITNGLDSITHVSLNVYYITTNYRVIYENAEEITDVYKEYITPPSQHHEKRYTFKFICDIGVSREFNRHRVNSIAEESTRYCNYSKDKFNNEINVIAPKWLSDIIDIEKYNEHLKINLFEYCDVIRQREDEKEFSYINYWLFANLSAEYSYMNLIRLGFSPQEARSVLPLGTKTTLIHTAFESDWKHFIDLRLKGTTGAPHPQAKQISKILEEKLKENEL